MSDSMGSASGSVVVVYQRPLVGDVGLPVPPDSRRHRQQPLGDSHEDAGGGASTVLFERELTLEGVVDALDPLADGSQRSESTLFVLAVGPDHDGLEGGSVVLEEDAREPFVAQDDLPGP